MAFKCLKMFKHKKEESLHSPITLSKDLAGETTGFFHSKEQEGKTGVT